MPVYQVEIIIFKNLDQSATTPELPRVARLPEAIEIETFTEDALERASEETSEQAAFEFVADSDLLMNSVYSRLNNLGAYQPVYYAGWRQTAAEGQALPLELARISDIPENISGKITLYRQRYLHLRVAVDILDPSVSVATGDGFWDSLGRNSQPASYTLTGTRRVRSQRLMYFDHPEYGILAQVTRLDNDAES
jgi:hypothetical protein